MGLLVALAAVLVPTLGVDWAALSTDPTTPEQADYRNAVRTDFSVRVAGQMASFYLLPALGMCLTLRCGAIDLSVWAAAAMGGVLGAVAINAGVPPAWAFVAAACSGAALGAVNGGLVAFARLPSPAVTIATGLAVVWVLQASVEGRRVEVPATAFVAWSTISDGTDASVPDEASEVPGGVYLSRPLLRMVVVVICYAISVLALLAADLPIFFGRPEHRSPPSRQVRFAALCAAGALSGLAGPMWVVEYGAAPVLSGPVGDLRVPAAAVLAGAAFYAGRGRILLVALCLPGALLLAGIWQREVWVWDLQVGEFPLQTLLLTVMVIVAHMAMARALGRPRAALRGRAVAIVAAALCAAGILLSAASVMAEGFGPRAALYVGGLVVWAVGAALVAVALVLRRRPATE